MNMSGSKRTDNNKLTNLTININSQHIQHYEVGYTWNYIHLYSHVGKSIHNINRAKQSLAIECRTVQLPQFRDCTTYSAFRCTVS